MKKQKDSELDLAADRKLLRQVGRSAKIKAAPIELHEDRAALRGYPAYGVMGLWDSPWVPPVFARIAITGKVKEHGLVSYTGRVVAILPGQATAEQIRDHYNLNTKSNQTDDYPADCVFFTANALFKWYQEVKSDHLRKMHYRADMLIESMVKIGEEARYVREEATHIKKNCILVSEEFFGPPKKKS